MPEHHRLLFLFDGHALIHRAFHALPPLHTKSGEPTGAVYGFTSMLLRIVDEFRPTHWAIAFDTSAPTFRHVDYSAYKEHRPKAPDELVSQFELVRQVAAKLGMPGFALEGYEADDILGALSRQAVARGISTVIVSGDTDTLQLVAPGIRVLLPRPGRPFSDTQLYDETAVQQRYGLDPAQIPDLKGMKGDPSDNIPGVPGIGDKTAVKLLQEFGSIERVFERIDEVGPPKIQQALRAHEPAARQSKKLATIQTDLPVDLDLPTCAIGAYDHAGAIDLFRRLEFTTLVAKLPQVTIEEDPTEPLTGRIETTYETVDSTEALDQLLADLSSARTIAVDTETTGKAARHTSLVGISLSTGPGKAWYIPVGHRTSGPQLTLAQVADKLKQVLGDPGVHKLAHNAKYDMTVLSRHGMKLCGLGLDTMIGAHLLGEKALGLKQLALAKLGVEMTSITSLIGSGPQQGSMAEVDISQAADYACADADMTYRLAECLTAELKTQGLWTLTADVEMPLVQVLLEMEENGVALNTTLLRNLSRDITQEMASIEPEIYNWVGHPFNINSTRQLGRVLFDELGLPTSRRTKSGYSTDATVLEGLRREHPIVEYLLKYRMLAKLKSTYVDALPALVDPSTGRVHTSYNQTATATGRLSSSDPNLQNIPIRTEEGKRIRQAFVAKDHAVLLSADYSQIELRIMAHLSQDPGLLAAFDRDEDIHTATAAEVFGVEASAVTTEMRRVAKTVNFGVIYGMSDYGLEQASGLSRREAADFIDRYLQKYAGIREYVNRTKGQAATHGFVQTQLGRRRYIPEILSSNIQSRQAAERMAINMPVQGTAADAIKTAMIEIHRRIVRDGLRSMLILQVHDELVFEVPHQELDQLRRLVLEVMPHALQSNVPLIVEVSVGENWGSLN